LLVKKRLTPAVGALTIGLAVAGYQLLRPEPVQSRHVPITTKIVFNREIAQIFQKKCFQCHTEGNVSMALTSYRDARPWAVAIKEEILDRRMPPWGAASGYGHFANDMSLTAREISLILSWADGGAPSGVLLADEDKPPVFIPPLNGWELGAPDQIVNVAEGTKIAADSPFKVERFEVATDLKQPKWLRALQLSPADRRVVRYAAIYETRSGRWLGTWTPSSQVASLPAGVGVQLPASARLTVEVGYRGSTEDVVGSGELGLYFAEDKPSQATSFEIAAPALSLAPGKAGERIRAEMTIKAAASASALWPRLGPGAKSLEVTAMRPDGTVEPMLWVNNYRADWPSSYILKDAVALPAGTRLVMTAYYDNPGAAALAAKPSVAITAVPARLRVGATARQVSRQPATLAR
jgi:hypothetical protein